MRRFLHAQTIFFHGTFFKQILLIEICRLRGFLDVVPSKMISKFLSHCGDPAPKPIFPGIITKFPWNQLANSIPDTEITSEIDSLGESIHQPTDLQGNGSILWVKTRYLIALCRAVGEGMDSIFKSTLKSMKLVKIVEKRSKFVIIDFKVDLT